MSFDRFEGPFLELFFLFLVLLQPTSYTILDYFSWNVLFYRYCFPFGRPEGFLKATLTLLDRVLMKDVVTPAPSDEVRSVIKKCLENAALVNYTKISETVKIEGIIFLTSLLLFLS